MSTLTLELSGKTLVIDAAKTGRQGPAGVGTPTQIKAAYESNPDTNEFNDAEKAKLAGIQDGATDDQTGAEIKIAYELENDTNAYTDAEKLKLGLIEDSATADQTGSEIKILYEAESNTNAFDDATKAKLSAIESGATADQTDAEIKTAYEANSNTNNFDDSAQSKLTGIETGATGDQTNSEIKSAYEANANTNEFSDAEKLKLAAVAPDANDYEHPDHTGDVTSTGDGAQTIGATKVLESMLSVAVQNKLNATGGFAYNPSGTVAPGANNDSNDTVNANDGIGFVVGSFWIDTVADQSYRCLDNTDGAAVWAKTTLSTDDLAAVAVSGSADDIIEGATTKIMTGDERTKLAGIEAGAKDDQTGAEIKLAYEAEANAFTDIQFTKLASIETNAKDDQTGAEIKTLYQAQANAFTDALFTKLASIEAGAKDDQTGAEIKLAYEAEVNAFTDALFTKLAGIETGAKDDQTDAEIKTAYENNSDTNEFNDAEKTKLADLTKEHSELDGIQGGVLDGDVLSSFSGGNTGDAVATASNKIDLSGSAWVNFGWGAFTTPFDFTVSSPLRGSPGSIEIVPTGTYTVTSVTDNVITVDTNPFTTGTINGFNSGGATVTANQIGDEVYHLTANEHTKVQDQMGAGLTKTNSRNDMLPANTLTMVEDVYDSIDDGGSDQKIILPKSGRAYMIHWRYAIYTTVTTNSIDMALHNVDAGDIDSGNAVLIQESAQKEIILHNALKVLVLHGHWIHTATADNEEIKMGFLKREPAGTVQVLSGTGAGASIGYSFIGAFPLPTSD